MESVITVTLNAAIDRILEVKGLRVGGHFSGRLIARVPAGKGVNVSRTLAALGVPSVATGFVGRGQLEDYERSLAGIEVQAQFLAVEAITRENITLIDPEAGIETHIRETGEPPTTGDLDRLRNKLNLLARPGGLVALSGSLPSGVAVDYAVDLVDMVLSKGARVSVDGSGELLYALRDRRLWLIKPNVGELAAMGEVGSPNLFQENGGGSSPAGWIRPPSFAGPRMGHTTALSDQDIVRIGRELSGRIRVVIVSRGSAGGYLFIDGSALLGQVELFPSSRVRSSVGCGDCLLGAFIAAQLRGDDVRKSYQYALAVATAAAMDTMPGQFDPAVVTELLGRTSVEPVE